MTAITRKPLSSIKVIPQMRKTFDETSLRRLGEQ